MARIPKLEEYLAQIDEWGSHIQDTCSDDRFLRAIVNPWLKDIAHQRAEQYGVEGLYRFGLRGIMAQLINCVERYKVLSKQFQYGFSTLDTIRDSFGYAVIMAVVSKDDVHDVIWNTVWKSHNVNKIYEALLHDLWYDDPHNRFIDSGRRSLCLSYGMWRRWYNRANI